MFLDEHGRRHRRLRPLALLAAVAAASWAVALAIGASGFGSLPALRLDVAARTLTQPAVVAAAPSAVRVRHVAIRTRRERVSADRS